MGRPSEFLPEAGGPPPVVTRASSAEDKTFDPLKLCIFTTIALLGWIFGPFALVIFAAVAFVAYFRARRAGLLISRCYLRDTRLVLLWLGSLLALGLVGVYFWVQRWLGS